jgi:hypothetical protein
MASLLIEHLASLDSKTFAAIFRDARNIRINFDREVTINDFKDYPDKKSEYYFAQSMAYRDFRILMQAQWLRTARNNKKEKTALTQSAIMHKAAGCAEAAVHHHNRRQE